MFYSKERIVQLKQAEMELRAITHVRACTLHTHAALGVLRNLRIARMRLVAAVASVVLVTIAWFYTSRIAAACALTFMYMAMRGKRPLVSRRAQEVGDAVKPPVVTSDAAEILRNSDETSTTAATRAPERVICEPEGDLDDHVFSPERFTKRLVGRGSDIVYVLNSY